MILRIIGAILIVVGCTYIGLRITFFHKREVSTLKQFIYALDYMECELQYRLTPLPQLCRKMNEICDGIVLKVFQELANEMDNQISPDVQLCMESVLSKVTEIPSVTRRGMELLGTTLGRFDVRGQIRDLNAVRNECMKELEAYTSNEDIRLRNSRTLAICAGIAVVIILF